MIEVLEGGIQTTIQDFPGRQGLLDQGICPAGPFDNLAFAEDGMLYLSSFTAPTITEVSPDGTERVITIGG